MPEVTQSAESAAAGGARTRVHPLAGPSGSPGSRGDFGGSPLTYLPSTAMSGNGNGAATAVSTEPGTLATSAFWTGGATIGSRLPPSVVYWSERLSVFLFFFWSKQFLKGQ